MTFARYMPRADLMGRWAIISNLYAIGGFTYELTLYVTFPPSPFPFQSRREKENGKLYQLPSSWSSVMVSSMLTSRFSIRS